MQRRLILTIVIILGLILVAQGCSTSSKKEREQPTSRQPNVKERDKEANIDLSKYTTGAFDGCSPEGDGGDPALNKLKNRDLPPPSFESMTVDHILANTPNQAAQEGKKSRDKWTSSALSEVHAWEVKGVTVEGYLVGIRQEGPEACNCHSNEDRDYHMWLASSSSDYKSQAVVVELSPRLLVKHQNWNKKVLGRLSSQGAKMRISGWLMWDQEHGDQVGQSRGTLWEIHPIHNIEVFSGGNWRSLDQ